MPFQFLLRPAVALFAGLSLAASAASAQSCPECEKAPEVVVGDTPFSGSATGCLIPAEQGGCPLPSNNTFFFSFTPTASGAYRISTCTAAVGGSLTVLSVRADCSPFSTIACGIAGCPSGGIEGSIIGGVELIEGLTYRIGIGAHCCAADFIESGILSIDPIDPPGTGCSSAGVAFVGPNVYDTSDLNEVVDLAGFCDPAPAGEPWDQRVYNTQYFKFTPPASGVYTISTCDQGEQVWERLAVLSGCSPTDGVVACSNANCSSDSDYAGARILGVELEAGVEYTLLVGGVLSTSFGTGVFTIEQFSPCPAPKPTAFEIEACGEDSNGGCLSVPSAAEPISLGDSVRGTTWAANGVRDTDWYVLDLKEGTEVTLELNAEFPGFATFVFADCTSSLFIDQTLGECPALTDGECLPAGQYYVVVAPYDFWGYPCGYPTGNEYTLTVTGRPCDASPPPNDLCVDALEAVEGATPFDNYFAGNDFDVPTCALIGRDVWFTFTAKESGDYKFAVCNGGVPFNSGMDIWTACPQEGGQVVACNRDANDPGCGNSVFSTIIHPMAAGETALIRVGSEWFFDFLPPGSAELVVTFIGDELVCGDPEAGDCCIARSAPLCNDVACCNFVCIFDPACCDGAWDETCVGSAALYCFDTCGGPPENDECSAPQAASVGANPFRNRQATGSTSTPCGPIYSDVWFEYTATTDQPVTISLCETDGGWALVTGGDSGDLDTRIAVFDSCSGNLVACSDNACGVRSRVSFVPDCDATYLIAIGSHDDVDGPYSQGIGSFKLIQTGSCGGACTADLNGDGEVGAQDLAALLNAWGGAAADLNGDGTTNAQDLAALLTAWGACAS
jgi:hypothetical protein